MLDLSSNHSIGLSLNSDASVGWSFDSEQLFPSDITMSCVVDYDKRFAGGISCDLKNRPNSVVKRPLWRLILFSQDHKFRWVKVERAQDSLKFSLSADAIALSSSHRILSAKQFVSSAEIIDSANDGVHKLCASYCV
jgi:hypothetical protein